jgi:hypothetical protein
MNFKIYAVKYGERVLSDTKSKDIDWLWRAIHKIESANSNTWYGKRLNAKTRKWVL